MFKLKGDDDKAKSFQCKLIKLTGEEETAETFNRPEREETNG
jgi:hypothetical protein